MQSSNSVHASSIFSSNPSNRVSLLGGGVCVDRLLPPEESSKLPRLVVSWITVTEPSLGTESKFSSSQEWGSTREELEGILDFASAMNPHLALIAWCVLRDVL